MPISEVIRRALVEEVRRREEEEVKAALDRARELLRRIPPEEIAAVVREGREER